MRIHNNEGRLREETSVSKFEKLDFGKEIAPKYQM